MRLQFKPFGDWNGATWKITKLPVSIKQAVMDGQEAAGNKLIKIVRKHIIAQDLPSFSQYPKVRPAHLSGVSDLLIDSTNYLQSLAVWRKQSVLYVGVKSSAREPNGVETARVAFWLETGTKTIPARPVWEPSIGEIGDADGLNKIVQKKLEAKLISDGWLPDF